MNNLAEQEWFQMIMESEGGFNPNEPASVGGKSYAGITQKAYDEWLEKKAPAIPCPPNVEDLAGSAIGTEWEKRSPLVIPDNEHWSYKVRVDVIVAFYTDYFYMARLEVVPKCLRYIHADFFVNSKFNANKILQQMVDFTGDDVDGILGPASREKIVELQGDEDDLIMEYHQLKLKHYHSIQEENRELYDKNIKGWIRRSNHILAQLEDYFHDEEPTTSAIHEDDQISLFDDPEVEPDEPYQPPVAHDKLKSDIIGEVSRELAQMLPEMIEEALKGQVTKSIMGRNITTQ